MEHQNPDELKKELIAILKEPTDKMEQLRNFATTVGASTQSVLGGGSIEATESQLVFNIHQAIQTASMVNMCETATEGYEMATKTSNKACINFWIAAGIAFLSAVAAWVAAFRN